MASLVWSDGAEKLSWGYTLTIKIDQSPSDDNFDPTLSSQNGPQKEWKQPIYVACLCNETKRAFCHSSTTTGMFNHLTLTNKEGYYCSKAIEGPFLVVKITFQRKVFLRTIFHFEKVLWMLKVLRGTVDAIKESLFLVGYE